MLKLRQLQKQKQEQLAASSKPTTASSPPQISSASQLRLRNDLASLDLPPCVKIDAAALETDQLLHIHINPDEGYYKSGTFDFEAKFKDTYPIDPPKVTLTSTIFHPNIDTQGNVCLNILREDWSPVLDVHSIIIGLLMLLLEPNATDPLNKKAADVLQSSPALYQRQVVSAMRGESIDGCKYDRVLR
ncbi:LAME_0H03488g1_1 [Lachancea meyersii CBS 8951]|uniref:NEDD8-conjugating enzyme UBC12 n=1 Tax=Lachancea meyersii CBS 8951 TaxID=1266667 RepID=A0A1G4KDR3_9SACH|nr:LAME_0H03488g1_1 [Lachancea meyersii CBS 8951]